MDNNYFEQKGKEGENVIFELTSNIFFDYWCYPNPRDELGDKKEICDLLVHFDKILILICIKNYEFKGNYSRYFRRVIEKDLRQLWGAEKKITTSDNDIQISKNSRKHVIKKNDIESIHRILIHLGEDVNFYPFNKKTNSEKFVHIFDKNSFFNIIKYLDTIKDFTEYLTKKEIFFYDKKVLILPGEENNFDENDGKQYIEYSDASSQFQSIEISGTESDLLADYIEHQRNFASELNNDEADMIHYQIEGNWEEFLKKDGVIKKYLADIDSYFIDKFILNVLEKLNSEDVLEQAVELLSFNRFERRLFGKLIKSFFSTYFGSKDILARRFGEISGIGIVLIAFPNYMSDEKLKILVPIFLDAYHFYAKYKFSKIIVCFSLCGQNEFSFFIKDKLLPFDLEMEINVKYHIQVLGLFKDFSEIQSLEKEFPDN